jgi:hypothetical protein
VLLRRVLRERPDIEGVFFDYPSLYQKPRDHQQEEAFKRALGASLGVDGGVAPCSLPLARSLSRAPARLAPSLPPYECFSLTRTSTPPPSRSPPLGVMGDLYASAIGTTVFQIKEIPPRPAEYDGALALFDLKVTDKSAIMQAFGEYGLVRSCEVGGWPEAIVRFSTHAAALDAKRAAHLLVHICLGIDTLYNERSYDGRRGEAGREDDDGRGWCAWPSPHTKLALPPCPSEHTIERPHTRAPLPSACWFPAGVALKARLAASSSCGLRPTQR